MDEEGVATYLGDAADVTFEQLKEAVTCCSTTRWSAKGMTRCARNLFDGRGPDRIVNGLEIMLHAPARKRRPSAVPAVPPLRAAPRELRARSGVSGCNAAGRERASVHPRRLVSSRIHPAPRRTP